MSRRRLNIIIFFSFILLSCILFINTRKYISDYNYNNNVVISNIISLIKEKYPDVLESEIIEILNSDDVDESILASYGILIDEDAISIRSQNIIKKMYITDAIIILILIFVVVMLLNIYMIITSQNVKKLIYYVEEINKKNYKLDLLSNKENDLSILQNEIYKTMVMLRESATNSLEDKKNLKNSLSDISHQLKTPLTSISIMLDNIIDDPKMDDKIRNDFIMDIKREIININFLVYNILKLSQFDINIVKFKRESINVYDVLKDALKNVSLLADLKNVSVLIESPKDILIKGDLKWEVEALTNIIKNSIEYSKPNDNVLISAIQTDVFTEIKIKDHGSGIEKEKIKRIFERFYKMNDSDSSFGIGLSLAKEIIEADNGRIKVKSEVGKGTEFIIRYMR